MSTSTLMYIQTQMSLYANPIIMVFGSIGNMFIFILFHRQRQNPCSIYLMHAAIANLMYLSIYGFLRIFPISYYDQTLRAFILCIFTIYIPTFLGQIGNGALMLACIDRYLITCNRARFRAFSTYKRAKYLIGFSYLFWLVLACPNAILTKVNNGQCIKGGVNATIFSVYFILFVGLIPSIILCVFGYLTFQNLRRLRRHVQPIAANANNTNYSIHRRDRDLLVIVIAEVIVYIITASLLPAILLEMTISGYTMPHKSSQYLSAESFTFSFALLLMFFLSATPFYTYMISSRAFRRDFKQLIKNGYLKLTRQGNDRPPLRTDAGTTQRETRV